jgi:hypothetical protein
MRQFLTLTDNLDPKLALTWDADRTGRVLMFSYGWLSIFFPKPTPTDKRPSPKFR